MIVRRAQDTPRERVRVLQRKLYRAAKGAPRRKFGVLYDKVYRREVLEEAWRRVRANRGSAGVDRQTIEQVEAYGVGRLLEQLESELKERRYRPWPVRRVLIPKPGKPGQYRGLGIPVVRDRVVQAAVKLVIEPILEADFRGCSYGFRPKRGPRQAIEETHKWIMRGYRCVIDADLKACFDTLPHEGIVAAVARRVSDPQILRLIRRWLKAGVLAEGEVRTVVAGTPQGGVISPLLANAYLHAFDVAWEASGTESKLIRYCDDFVILCRGDPQRDFRQMKEILSGLGLTLNAEKTRVVTAGEGFDFLGMHFRMRPTRIDRSRLFCYRWPSTKAMNSVRRKICEALKGSRLPSLDDRLRKLNPILRGWGQYFRASKAHRHFHKIDRHVHWKLVNYMRRKHKLPRRGSGRAFPPAFFTRAGLYRLSGTIVRITRMPGGERCRKAG